MKKLTSILIVVLSVAIVAASLLAEQAFMKSRHQLKNEGDFVMYCSIDSITAKEYRGSETKPHYIEMSTAFPTFAGPRPCEIRYIWAGIVWDVSGIIHQNGKRTELETFQIYRLVSPTE